MTPTKVQLDQHNILHENFPNNCCLCKANDRVKELQIEIAELRAKIVKDYKSKRLSVEKMTYILDKEFCKQHPKAASLLTAMKWNNIPSIMNKLALAIYKVQEKE